MTTKVSRKSFKRRAVRAGLLAVNAVVLVVVLAFVLQNTHTGNAGLKSASAAGLNADSQLANPLDQLSSADIALTVAQMGDLPETTAINNQADSQAVELNMAPTSDNVVAKPQVVATALKSKADITSYTTVAGDTLSSIAAKYGVTSDSIRWSNSLGTGDNVSAGQKLTIPPVNGIVYTVAAGDTADTLAAKYSANKEKIVAFNDAEVNGITTGEKIVIPDGSVKPVVAVAAPVYNGNSTTSFAFGGSMPIYGYNGYDYGYCTYYVASRISVPSNWGNASTWDNLAPLSGWTVSTTPQVGAVAQTDVGPAGEGHVAYVEAVSADGTQIKYSDMNGLAGWGRVGFSDWVPSTHFEHYIYH